MSEQSIRVGILGAGRIARTMAATLRGLAERGGEGILPYAVGARELSRGEALAEEFGFEKAYGSYEELLSDPALDLVYIATPHSHHGEQVKLCLEHGKHVLCEKAFTANLLQAEEILALAEEKGLLLTEAIWTRYLPSRRLIDEILASGELGRPLSLTANLDYNVTEKPRLVEPELAGGALLDVGVYPINFAMMVFGEDYQSVSGTAVLTEKGVDARESITMVWPGGEMAVLHADMEAESDRMGIVNCEKGFLAVQNINNPEQISLFDRQHRLIRTVPVPEQITGYEYEVLACRDAIRAGRIECPEMPHAVTRKVMALMDGLRRDWGVVYPFEV